MRYKLWIASLWPGCWHAWRGEWRGLALAIGFAIALNATLVVTFGSLPAGGSGWMGPIGATMHWVLVLGLWSCGLVWLWRDRAILPGGLAGNVQKEIDARFQQAQEEYLRGHWIEAETLLAKLLRENLRDVEARLLLASVQRRTTRWSEARQTLRSLHDEETASHWRLEIETELARIEELESEANAKPHEESDGEGELIRAA